ncbi:MAG TPA: DUF4870 domain-containing protein [Opitutaceae bacterium]|nr:DUF4870 domain-containing protein [Opitutaceae bacterium]
MTTITVTPALSGNDKLWSVLCHLSGFFGFPFLLPLVVYLVMRRDSEYIAAHAREALNFHISIFIYLLCTIPFFFILIGYPMAVVIGIGAFILSIVAAVKTANGVLYQYPCTIRLVK